MKPEEFGQVATWWAENRLARRGEKTSFLPTHTEDFKDYSRMSDPSPPPDEIRVRVNYNGGVSMAFGPNEDPAPSIDRRLVKYVRKDREFKAADIQFRGEDCGVWQDFYETGATYRLKP